VRNVMRKLNAKNRTDVAMVAMKAYALAHSAF
jgi:DNA-binding NarL/FixJ family response regulator